MFSVLPENLEISLGNQNIAVFAACPMRYKDPHYGSFSATAVVTVQSLDAVFVLNDSAVPMFSFGWIVTSFGS